MTKSNKPYVPDLNEHLNLCELNYARLEKLLLCLDELTQLSFGLDTPNSFAESSEPVVTIKIMSRAPFTTMLQLTQTNPSSAHITRPMMNVCLYHDAKLAEVISFQNKRTIKGKYTYPNKNMFLPDEKVQNNQFLAEWLQHCLRDGLIAVNHSYT